MKNKVYRSKYEAYHFLNDIPGDLKCDFEILSDEIASHIGLLRALIEDNELKEELLKIIELVYHVNPSLRTSATITADEVKWLEDSTSRINKEVEGKRKNFVLPQGKKAGSLAHIIRTKCNSLVRMLYRYNYSGRDVEDIIFDFTNLLSGYFLNLAYKLNDLDGVEEVEFTSRNYKWVDRK